LLNINGRTAARLHKFFSYYRPYRRLLLLDLLCAFVVSAITLLIPLCTSIITKQILGSNTPDALTQLTLMGGVLIGLVVVHTACNTFVDYRGHVMGTLMESDMRLELFNHYQKLSFSFYDAHKTGQLMTPITSDLVSLSEFYHHGPEDLAIAVLKGIGVFVLLITINVPLTLIIFLFLPIMAAYAFYFNGHMNKAMRKSRARIGDINAQVEDSLSGIRVVKSFTNERIEREKFAYENQQFVESSRDGHKSEAFFYGGMIAFSQLITVVVIILGGMAIVSGTLDLADLLTYLLCVSILIDPIQRAVNFAQRYQEGVTGFNRFMELLEIAPDIQDAPAAVDLPRVHGDITFENVSFRYQQHHDDVLKNLSFRIVSGEYVALVGASGVGKTTLCSLIPRFYEVSDGAVLIDGYDIRDVRLQSLRNAIGVVQQDVYLFAGSVAENIHYGKLDATHDEMIAAAKKANAHEFIMALPDAYETDIGQRGVKLSGGQKQRLSIARVFLKDPPILIFDEATSALDNESERAVQQSMEKLSENRTTLVIAHRLSTIRNARRILVLTDHGIAEEGTHDELIATNGAYAHLYNVQLTML